MAGEKTGQKGGAAEEMLKAYFWAAGYFAVRGVPFRLDGEDVTDVDLWLYERPAALTRRRLILDAKNKKVPKAAERLVWVRGLQAALGVDGAIVASTDKRPSSKRLAKAMGVTLLDGNALSKLSSSKKLSLEGRLASEDFDNLFKAVDGSRGSVEWREALLGPRAALLSSFGIHSANTALRAAGYFGEQAILSAPKSPQAQIALRGFYSNCALAAVALDQVVADLTFRSREERREALTNGIRYGHTDTREALSTVRAAVALIRQHTANGSGIAKLIEKGFEERANQVPAETIADYLTRVSSADSLFSVARELEWNAYNVHMAHFDDLSLEARSLLGVFIDFHELSREKIAVAGIPGAPNTAPETNENSQMVLGTLFPDDHLSTS